MFYLNISLTNNNNIELSIRMSAILMFRFAKITTSHNEPVTKTLK